MSNKLSQDQKQSGRSAVQDIIDYLHGNPGSTSAEAVANIEATVSGCQTIELASVFCKFIVPIMGGALIDIFWEDAGLPVYKSVGLYGEMNSDFQEVVALSQMGLRISGANYEITLSQIRVRQ